MRSRRDAEPLSDRRLVVCTGGEPLLQLDAGHRCPAHARVRGGRRDERNATAASGLDWICGSPKVRELVLRKANELKLVFPQAGLDPAQLEMLEFEQFFLQPMDGPNTAANTSAAIDYCLAHPKWRLSIQMHKLLGLR